MRPGKPLAFGHYKETPFIGLPGNPVSAFVGFEVFVRPAIGRLAGILNGSRPVVRVRIAEEINSDGRESYLRGYMYDFIEMFAPHLQRPLVERFAAAQDRAERDALAATLSLPRLHWSA